MPSGLVVMETQFIFLKKNISKVENLATQLIRRVRFKRFPYCFHQWLGCMCCVGGTRGVLVYASLTSFDNQRGQSFMNGDYCKVANRGHKTTSFCLIVSLFIYLVAHLFILFIDSFVSAFWFPQLDSFPFPLIHLRNMGLLGYDYNMKFAFVYNNYAG